MHNLQSGSSLGILRDEVLKLAQYEHKMSLPEVRFFVLEPMEFTSLLEKKVYPSSPVNIWEGKKMVHRKHSIANGHESSIYYEVVQTGNPSYAYLNDGNSDLTQASVMAHVCGHCEFSEINVLEDSDHDRTEHVMYLVKKTELARRQMGERRYINYWNACESIIPFISPNSQFKLDNSIEKETIIASNISSSGKHVTQRGEVVQVYSDSLNALLKQNSPENHFVLSEQKRQHHETLNRRGYRLRAPCQDIAGFLRNYAPASSSEHAILDYMCVCHQHQDFVMRTQIMNEGWAMYWEKKIMMDLFRQGLVKGVIDYSKVFSGVCYPRPYYARNPYHLGYHLWCHIENLLNQGKVTLAYMEETDRETKDNWNRETGLDAHEQMRRLVGTITDYEFIRRFLTEDLIERYHLNRIPMSQAQYFNFSEDVIVKVDKYHLWVVPAIVKDQMLDFFVHFNRPRIYVIDSGFMDGGLLLYHRDDGRSLRHNWIKPTLHNFHLIWKAPVYLLSREMLYGYTSDGYVESNASALEFDHVCERMGRQEKPFTV